MLRWIALSASLLGLCLVSCNTVTVPIGNAQEPMDSSLELTQQLTAEFERQLAAQGGKGISDVTGVYVDPLGRVDAGGDSTLSWDYNNTGDYDQNSEVNAADITPIVLHYGKTPGSPGWDAAIPTDGDSNGEVNLADITPIVINYLSSVTNYVVEADILGNDTWVPVANVPFGNGVEPAGGGLLEYSVEIPAGASASEFRVSAGSEVPPGDLVPIGPGPTDFQIEVTAPTYTGVAPFYLNFDVTCQNHSGDILLEIDDGDGGGVDEPHWDGTTFNQDAIYGVAGVFTLEVVATDNITSDTHTVSREVTVSAAPIPPLYTPGNWTTYNIEDGPNYGQNNALALVNGMPVIVYNREDRHDVMFARAEVAKPTDISDWVTMTVDNAANRGGTLDVVESQGVPCVVFEAFVDQDVYFANASSNTPGGAADWLIHEIDVNGISAPQIENLDDNPVISYRTGGSVRFARSSVVGGFPVDDTGWVTVDVEDVDFQEFPRLAIVGGFPAVAYKHKHGGYSELVYSHADSLTPDLPSNWSSMIIDARNDNTGNDIVLIEADGMAVIGYSNYPPTGPRFLSFARANEVIPVQSDWDTMDVRQADQIHYGVNLGMTWLENRPLMFHHAVYTASPSELHLSYPSSVANYNAGTFQHAILDPAPTYIVNEGISSISLADGTPVVVYRTNDGLKYCYYTP